MPKKQSVSWGSVERGQISRKPSESAALEPVGLRSLFHKRRTCTPGQENIRIKDLLDPGACPDLLMALSGHEGHRA